MGSCIMIVVQPHYREESMNYHLGVALDLTNYLYEKIMFACVRLP